MPDIEGRDELFTHANKSPDSILSGRAVEPDMRMLPRQRCTPSRVGEGRGRLECAVAHPTTDEAFAAGDVVHVEANEAGNVVMDYRTTFR